MDRMSHDDLRDYRDAMRLEDLPVSTLLDFKYDSALLCYLDLYIEDCYLLLIGGERLAECLRQLKDYEYVNDLSNL